MHAALITGQSQVELREFDDPTPSAAGAVVDISFCGICGTDIHAFQSGNPYNPAICGHEWVGSISALGSDASRSSRLGEGDRVVVAVPPPCGQCETCRAGQTTMCRTVFGVAVGRDPLAPKHGGFAPQIAVGIDRLVAADSRLTDEQAAQVEPSTVAFHAVRKSGVRLGDIAVVQGAGPIGLVTMQWVKAAGAGEVIVVEPNEARRALATDLGATMTATPDDIASVLDERTRGRGADIVYECVGKPQTIQRAVELARRGGSMCLIGLADSDATITPHIWLVKEINMTSALAYTHEEFEMAMGMIGDGRVIVDPMHSCTTSLDGLADALADLASGQSEQTKVLVNPNW